MSKFSIIIPIVAVLLIIATAIMMSAKAPFSVIIGGIIIVGSIFSIVIYFEKLYEYGFKNKEDS